MEDELAQMKETNERLHENIQHMKHITQTKENTIQVSTPAGFLVGNLILICWSLLELVQAYIELESLLLPIGSQWPPNRKCRVSEIYKPLAGS